MRRKRDLNKNKISHIWIIRQISVENSYTAFSSYEKNLLPSRFNDANSVMTQIIIPRVSLKSDQIWFVLLSPRNCYIQV